MINKNFKKSKREKQKALKTNYEDQLEKQRERERTRGEAY